MHNFIRVPPLLFIAAVQTKKFKELKNTYLRDRLPSISSVYDKIKSSRKKVD